MLPFSDEQETNIDLPVSSMPLSQLTEKGGGGSAVEQINSDQDIIMRLFTHFQVKGKE